MSKVFDLMGKRCQSREIADGCQCEKTVGHKGLHQGWGTIFEGPPDNLREVPFQRTWGIVREARK